MGGTNIRFDELLGSGLLIIRLSPPILRQYFLIGNPANVLAVNAHLIFPVF